MASEKRSAKFNSKLYEVESVEHARALILTAEQGTTTDERWEKETDFLASEIGETLALKETDIVLDYGCGIGRVSKGLIEQYGCRVVGVDASKSMRLMAPDYVLSERFVVWSPETLLQMVEKGFRASKALTIWVLQHVLEPESTVDLVRHSMMPNAELYVVNGAVRCVPSDLGYVNDGKDIREILKQRFTHIQDREFPETATTESVSGQSLLMQLRRED